MVELVTIGEITLDDIVLLNGLVKKGVVGGGALYSAIGACIWGSKVGIHSITGNIFYKDIVKAISNYKIMTDGIKSIDGHGIELWLLHESELDKQQVPKLSSKQYIELDLLRDDLPVSYMSAKAFHIAPQSVQGQKLALKKIHDAIDQPIISLDLQADKFIDIEEYKKGFYFNKITAFLPSREEIKIIWGEENIERWFGKMISANIPYIVVKMGKEGSMFLEKESGSIVHVPAYPARVKDTTGAGDSFCGGFLAGLQQGKDAIDAVVMGTVSASFVVECMGALNIKIPSRIEIEKRAKYIRDRIGNCW